MSAYEEAQRRWPDWICPPADEDPEPDYSEIDAKWQNMESEMQRQAFLQGAAWIADRSNGEAVEAIARTLWDADQYGFDYITKWKDAAELGDEYRRLARTALTALQGLMEGK